MFGAPLVFFSPAVVATAEPPVFRHAGLFACLLLLVALTWFLRRFGTAWSMRRWHKTQGRVITAEMRRGKKKSSDGSLLYDPVLRYAYQVGGRMFESSLFTHRAVSNAANLATQQIARLTQGAEVPVYYHPRNPAHAVLQPMPWRAAAAGAAVCAVLLLGVAARLLFRHEQSCGHVSPFVAAFFRRHPAPGAGAGGCRRLPGRFFRASA